MKHSTENYFRHNIVRIVELGVFVAVMFVTMQVNIESQAQLIRELASQSKETTKILNDISLNMARVQVRLQRTEEDVRSLADHIGGG